MIIINVLKSFNTYDVNCSKARQNIGKVLWINVTRVWWLEAKRQKKACFYNESPQYTVTGSRNDNMNNLCCIPC